jgi:Crinkler effector protein N-terminal domain
MSEKINLWCWVKNDEFDEDTLLQVNITISESISKLKQAIIQLLSESVSVTRMKLWKPKVGKLYCFGAKV